MDDTFAMWDNWPIGTQNCFSTIYMPYTNVKISAQNAPKCNIARQKNENIFWGGGTVPAPNPSSTGDGDTLNWIL